MRKRDIPAGSIGSSIVPCHQCEGTGQVGLDLCHYCGGDGEIVLRIDYIKPEPKTPVALPEGVEF